MRIGWLLGAGFVVAAGIPAAAPARAAPPGAIAPSLVRPRGAKGPEGRGGRKGPGAGAPLRVSPTAVVLEGPEASAQLLVAAGASDLTRAAEYASANPRVVTVGPGGRLLPVRDGAAEVVVRRGGQAARARVTVRGVSRPVPVSFEQQVIPVLSKAGCNAGGCHGKAEGQNGFKLSVFGFDPAADYQALVMEGRGRRLFLPEPDRSLLLQKATATLPHGGGRRFAVGDPSYRLLRRWIAEGARLGTTGVAPIAGITVEPAQRSLVPKAVQQLRVIATDAAGARHDVTAGADFKSNAGAVAEVDGDGWVQTTGVPGEAAILVRYMGQVAVSRITVPQPGVRFAPPRGHPPESNFIDRLVWDRLEALGIPPSGPCDDATFLRRASLDVIGTLPTAAEAMAFLSECALKRRGVGPSDERVWVRGCGGAGVSKGSVGAGFTRSPAHPFTRAPARSQKTRERLVTELLNRPEYADYWAMKWADLLRVDKDVVSPEGAVAVTRWLRRQFAENRPYDRIVRDVVTAQGPVTAEGPAAFYQVLAKPEEASRSISQLFLGVRIECAQCHHHPSERWAPEDYAGLAGFFTGLAKKSLPGGGQAIVCKEGADAKHPRTGQPVPTRALGAAPASFQGAADRRAVLADWMTAPENPYLARAIVNRLWAHYFGRGLVEPVDDLRATNPATNAPLLDALAARLRALKWDLKAFTRELLLSQAYQRSSAPRPENRLDEQNFSHMAQKALPAEVLLDALCQATGTTEPFMGWPEGYRAIQVWDNRMPSYFFRIFGRPARVSVCECERSSEPSISQALHLMNSPEIGEKIHARGGTARRLAESALSPAAIVEELCLGTLSRLPTAAERKKLLALFQEAKGDRRAAAEDVLWTLLNSKEFVYNH